MYTDREPPVLPPCETCRVVPFEENRDALEIFFVTQYQLIMGPERPLDINHLAVHAAIGLYEIEDRKGCFNKVRKLAHWWLTKIKR